MIPELSCSVQARIGKYISPDEEWLRMLVRELTPVLKVMRDNNLPSSKTLSKSMSFYEQHTLPQCNSKDDLYSKRNGPGFISVCARQGDFLLSAVKFCVLV